ncbi:hypothetical protein EDB81DRAFT_656965 [Dactylonectria macrodidyma]|uniref:Rho-GAP domain-containing protein n=1 Tax=Dactylonectria macrodidyma TaxID=307937 RepID=A0A9P9IZW2_9HYPO|nr:hypothetical protein EDB81DRAFT_656965 [Dactylonectria macrodidyma]
MDPFSNVDALHPHAIPIPLRRMLPSASSGSFNFPQSFPMRNSPIQGPRVRTSGTWTTSSGDRGRLSDTDEVGNRAAFVQEYNRLAKKHGVRVLVLEDFDLTQARNRLHSPQKRGWFHRILRSASNQSVPVPRPQTLHGRNKRSVSDLAHAIAHPRRETPQSIDIQSMVRLSGKSVLYLPSEHAPSALVLPTCLRATAHYLTQHVATRGIFRIPGSVRVVNALFDYYCQTERGGIDIAGTIRCANLPRHIQVSVHDIASTFKRLLSIIPGGILGSLHTFDALVAIHSQLNGDPEFPRTKHTKVRARLIALAISTIQSTFRRELICAVFGLLSLIGRVAEVTPREDDEGRPLPTGDLMGYSALGIVFGPLLLGDLLDTYSMKLAVPDSGLLLLPLNPPKPRQDRHRPRGAEVKGIASPALNKILIANGITEMLIANWRDIVRQMKSLGIQPGRDVPSLSNLQTGSLPPSSSESFVIRKPSNWEQEEPFHRDSREEVESFRNLKDRSPEPDTPTLVIRRQRPPKRKSSSSNRLGKKPSVGILSPTAEEMTEDEQPQQSMQSVQPEQETPHRGRQRARRNSGIQYLERNSKIFLPKPGHGIKIDSQKDSEGQRESQSRPVQKSGSIEPNENSAAKLTRKRREPTGLNSPGVSMEEDVRRKSSKATDEVDLSTQKKSSEYVGVEAVDDTITITEPTPIERRKAQRVTHGGRERPDVRLWSTVRSDGREMSLSSRSFSFSDKQDEKAAGIENSQLPWDQHDTSKMGFRTPSDKLILSYSTPHQDPSPIAMESQLRFESNNCHKTSDQRKPPSAMTSAKVHGATDSTCGSAIQAPIHRNTIQIHGSISGKSDDKTFREQESHNSQSSSTRGPKEPEMVSHQVSRYDTFPGGTSTPLRPSGAAVSQLWSGAASAPQKIPARPSVSQVAKKRGAVKAMAAMFEGEEPKEINSLQLKPQSRTQSLISLYSQPSPERSGRVSRSGSVWTQQSGRMPSTSSMDQRHSLNLSGNIRQQSGRPLGQVVQNSMSENASLRDQILMNNEHQNRSVPPDKPEMLLFRKPIPARKPVPERNEASLQSPPSLGTMIPHPEQPPVAQHLNFIRPSSSTSNFRQEVESLSLPHDASSLTPRPGSTSMLHSQIRSLQRQLDSKTEEATQLRRQLEVQENADVGTMSQQLRQAMKEAQMWKERAEAAERRVKVFERFTARLRGMREAAAIMDRRSNALDSRSGSAAHDGDNDGGRSFYQKQQLASGGSQRIGRRSSNGDESDTSGRTEDAGVITARIRKCLHGGAGQLDGSLDSTTGSDLLCLKGLTNEVKDIARKDRMQELNHSAVEIWMAAVELPDLNETR